MGSGKSTIGKLLASDLKMDFMDVDQVIEENYHKTIGQIFSIEGEEKFRQIESGIINNSFNQNSNMIVSVGGGLPCFHNNIDTMNTLGTTVYLKMSVKAIYDRLSQLPPSSRAIRPLLANKTNNELYEYISETLLKREAFYNKAKLIILNETSDAAITVDRIKMAINYL